MAESKPLDLGAMFGEAVTNWERQFDQNANTVMGTEAFSLWMNQFQQSQLAMQKAFSGFMMQQLHTMQVPTKEDVTRLGEAVLALDKRMDRLERTLDKLLDVREQRGSKRKKVKRTRQPEQAVELATARSKPAEPSRDDEVTDVIPTLEVSNG